jgi:5-methylcytosine-specific restriction endonuclease McrA
MTKKQSEWKKKTLPQKAIHKGITLHILGRIKKKNPKKYKKIIFNMVFLRKMRKAHGPLWCVYCGGHVEICPIGTSKPRAILATADHFLPSSVHPELEFSFENLRVCCLKCNNKKGDKMWEEQYPYPNKQL